MIATDGLPCAPFRLTGWPLGRGMRADLALRSPQDQGAVVELQDLRAAKPVTVARLVTTGGTAGETSPFAPPRLHAASIPVPDLDAATVLPFELSTAGGGRAALPPI